MNRAALSEITSQALAEHGQALLAVVSDSMAPLIRRGDRVLVQSIEAAQVKAGDIIVFRQGAVLMTHRLLRRMPDGLETKGDRVAIPDPVVEPEAVLGLVVQVERPRRAGSKPELCLLRTAPWQIIGRLGARLSRLEAGMMAWGERSFGRMNKIGRWVSFPFRAANRLLMAASALIFHR